MAFTAGALIMKPFTLMWWLEMYLYYESKCEMLHKKIYHYEYFTNKSQEFIDVMYDSLLEFNKVKHYVRERIRKYER